MRKQNWFLILTLFILASCSDEGGKKVLVISSGNFEVGENTVQVQGGSSHNEKEMMVTGDKLTVNSESGSQDFDLTQNGFYVLNLKKDTLVGSYQRVGTETNQQVITQDDLKVRVDSLTQLMAGQNVSEAKRNFSIPPQQITRITENLNAQIIGPFKRVPGSFEPGKEHEIYKFYTNKEMQEIVDKLKGMMSDPEAEEE